MKPSINPISLIKIPPQDLVTEGAILGSLMSYNNFHEVSGIIGSESFYSEIHQKIFKCIESLNKKGSPVDFLSISSELKSLNLSDKVEISYLSDLAMKSSYVSNLPFHARKIADLFAKREIIRLSMEVQEMAFEDADNIEEILNEIRLQISEIENIYSSGNSGKEQKEVLKNTIIEIEEESKNKGLPGIPTGFFHLNELIGGWRNQNLIVIAARPGIGKTALALHFTRMAAKAGFWVNFYGLEMKAEDTMRINLSAETGINRTKIRDSKIDDKDWGVINKILRSLEGYPIIWNDFAGITANQISSLTTRNRKRRKCDMVVIDYLGQITPTLKNGNREQQVSDITRTIKRMALSENIPVILLCQLNREGVEKPKLHHLRESGAIEQDADIVLFPWVNDDDNSYNLILAKNRRGISNKLIKIERNSEMTVFEDKKKDTGVNMDLIYNPNETIESTVNGNVF